MITLPTENLAIEIRNIELIKPHPNNARTHSKKQIAQIAKSINEFGFTNPLLLDPDGVVIAGHGRLEAARSLGLKEVPTITLAHLTPTQIKALRIADNKIALNSGWDPELLRVEIKELKELEVGFDVELTGFTAVELDSILTPKADPDDDFVPPQPKDRARLGDIWELGEHRVGCGDSRDLDFVREVVGGWGKVDCAFLDPPYNVAIQGHANVASKHPEFLMASGEMEDEEFARFLHDALSATVAVSRAGAVHFLCMDWRHLGTLSSAAKPLYGEQLNLCVWNKSNAGMGSLYRSKHELVLVYRVGATPHYNAVELGRHGRNRTNVWDYASVNSFGGGTSQDLALHPTVKPAAMVADAIRDVTKRGELVLDTFLGSGTTLIACERSGRRCRAVELSPLYVNVAIERWVTMTGGEPTRIREGGNA